MPKIPHPRNFLEPHSRTHPLLFITPTPPSSHPHPFSFALTSHHITTMKLMNVVGSLFTASSKSRRHKRRNSITKHTSSFSSTTSSSSSSSDCPNSATTTTTTTTTPKSVLPISIADVFNLFDRDRDGKITKLELESVLRQLGPDPLTDGELATMVREMDVDGDGCISLEELSVIGDEAMAVADDDDDDDGGAMMEEMRGVFRVFDVDGDGKISAEELKGVFEVLGEGEECGMEECRRMIQGVDSDGDGFVGFEDFVKMMRMGAGGHRL